jgi:hypothetical protein
MEIKTGVVRRVEMGSTSHLAISGRPMVATYYVSAALAAEGLLCKWVLQKV